MLHEIKENTLEINERIGNLNRETEVIKKKQMETLELQNIKSEIKKFTGWA